MLLIRCTYNESYCRQKQNVVMVCVYTAATAFSELSDHNRIPNKKKKKKRCWVLVVPELRSLRPPVVKVGRTSS